MSRRSSRRSADAIEALAVCLIAKLFYPSARELADYLEQTDDETIRADARQFAAALGSLSERLQGFFTAHEDNGSTERAAELEQQAAALRRELEAAQLQRHALQREADELGEQLQRNSEAHQAEVQVLSERDQEAQTQIGELAEQLEAAQEEINKLKARSDSYAAALIDRAPAPDDLADDIADAQAQFTISGVIEMAREKCERVIIPDAALKEIDTLSADEKAADWARELWKGLRALNAYAEESKFFSGGFWEWCEHSNSEDNLWPATPKKLAMKESDTVMNSGPLRRTRRFLVDNAVDPSGYIVMVAHLKIAEGGGQHIPRLFFHDDAKGRTGAMHVGFIGPHRLVPNSQS